MHSFRTYIQDQKDPEKKELYRDETGKNKTDLAEEYQLTISKDLTNDPELNQGAGHQAKEPRSQTKKNPKSTTLIK